MTDILQDKSLEEFLKPLEGKYSGVQVAKGAIIERLTKDELYEPSRALVKIRTMDGKQFCTTTYAGNLDDVTAEKAESSIELMFASEQRKQVDLIGVGTALNPTGWHELVYVAAAGRTFDLRSYVLETIDRYNTNP